MGVRRNVLPRFLLLYGTLYGSFGLSSPFLPAFLAARGVGPEALGLLLGAGTAVRLLSAPLAGRLADVFGAFRLELVLFAISAAMVSLLYLPAHWFWMLALVNLTQAAMLAPLVPLSDALALSWSRSTTRNNSGAFEYGWVRGTGSAAFMAGLLVAGQAVGALGLASVIWFTPANRWLAAALVLGSHAMHDAFAMIRWRDAGISPAASSVLWSESVAAEVLVFLLLGPLTFIARWESLDWVPLTYPDPAPSLTSAVYLACLLFFLAFLLLARRERL